MTTNQAPLAKAANRHAGRLGPPALLLAVWFLISLVGGTAGVLQSAPWRPPLPLLVAVAGPPLIFPLVDRGSRLFRDFVLRIGSTTAS